MIKSNRNEPRDIGNAFNLNNMYSNKYTRISECGFGIKLKAYVNPFPRSDYL